eukprot:m.89131 g.89131  ORF g.89131 m.89131 type:complete len:361 (+) comp13206_c0_seq2:1499-2581(+)
MHLLLTLTLFAFSSKILISAQTLDLNLFVNATARKAVCNDGTPGGYYLSKVTNSTKWMIYLEGGGLCYSLETCKKRSIQLTSSSTWPKTLEPAGILADAQFADYNKVFVGYCTSDLYSGNNAPSANPLLKFNFYGSYIVPALLTDLRNNNFLTKMTDVLLMGGSAGGIGTLVNTPYVRDNLAAYNISVKILADAGWFLTTVPPYSKSAITISEQLQEGMKLWNGLPPLECKLALKDTAYNCYSGPFLYPFLKDHNNIMILKAQTDAWTLGNDGVKMPPNVPEALWMAKLAEYVRATFILDNVTNVFSANCVYHTSLLTLWDTVAINNVKLKDAVSSWYFNNQHVVAVDSCATPLCNPSCL